MISNVKRFASRIPVGFALISIVLLVVPMASGDDVDRSLPPSLAKRVEVRDVSVDADVEHPTAPLVAPASVFVTSTQPGSLMGADRQVSIDAFSSGPFNAHETLNLYIVSMFDLRELGEGAFDQVTRFTLPDGSIYETRITPVDPESDLGDKVERADLAVHPVPVVRPEPASVLARQLPTSEKSANLSQQRFTSVMLPVSGTWITKHNLYGEWLVEVHMVRDGSILTTATAAFELGEH